MLKLFKLTNELKLKRENNKINAIMNKIINKDFNIDSVTRARENVENDLIPLENDIFYLAKSEGLGVVFNEKEFYFYNVDNPDIKIEYKDGVFTNRELITDEEHSLLLSKIAQVYSNFEIYYTEEVAPNQLATNEKPKTYNILEVYNTINFEHLKNLYLINEKYYDDNKKKYKDICKELDKCSREIIEETDGLYRIRSFDTVFGYENVEKNITKGIILVEYLPGEYRWEPYSKDVFQIRQERDILEEAEEKAKERKAMEKNYKSGLEKFIEYYKQKKKLDNGSYETEIEKQKSLMHTMINHFDPVLQEQRKMIM